MGNLIVSALQPRLASTDFIWLYCTPLELIKFFSNFKLFYISNSCTNYNSVSSKAYALNVILRICNSLSWVGRSYALMRNN